MKGNVSAEDVGGTAGLRLLSNICEALNESWVLTTLPCGEVG